MNIYFTILFTLVILSRAQEESQEESQYIPAKAEQQVIDEENFGSSSGCLIWKKESPLRDSLNVWKKELRHYNENLRQKNEFAPDLRTLFSEDYSNREEVCSQYADPPENIVLTPQDPAEASDFSDPKTVETKYSLRGRSINESEGGPSLMQEYFNESQLLSYLPKHGYMEPLLPPLRHPDMCIPGQKLGASMSDMSFMIEDFGHICRNVLQKNTRTVFLDLGATYNFKSNGVKDTSSPAIRTIEKYRRNGIHFDHIYAYEITKWDTDAVYRTIPQHMHGPMHWINTGVTGEENHQHNPWTMLAINFRPEDYVVVKLDIDNIAHERPIFHQLLRTPQIQELVDVFYFEHHVKVDEMQELWGAHDSGSTKGTIMESLRLFQKLRRQGVAAHYWI